MVRQALIEFHWSEAQRLAEAARLQQISRMLSAQKIKAITYVAKGCRATGKVFGTEAAFDAHPDLLNVPNGVVDLRTGTLRPHDPDLLFTKVTKAPYRPGATHPDWQQALTAIPKDAADWLQIRMGQGLTGHPPSDDVMVTLKGAGENGKSTIVDGVREAVGTDYAVTVPDRVLLARTGDHPTELMTLRGARLGLMEEFPELGHLNVKRLKDLHGVGEMTARYCGKDTVAWKPSHTVFVTSNYLPRVDESDHGTWRRLALVDFPYRYRKADEPIETKRDRRGDPGLRQRMGLGRDGRHEAVLAWLIYGAVTYYRNGQVMPEHPAGRHPPGLAAGTDRDPEGCRRLAADPDGPGPDRAPALRRRDGDAQGRGRERQVDHRGRGAGGRRHRLRGDSARPGPAGPYRRSPH